LSCEGGRGGAADSSFDLGRGEDGDDVTLRMFLLLLLLYFLL